MPDHELARRQAEAILSGDLVFPQMHNLAAAYIALAGRSREVEKTDAVRAEFEEWYREYPRKKQPESAFRAYRKARKIASAAQLLTALRSYRWASSEAVYTPYPATWLNGGAWRENPADEPQKQKQIDIWAQAARSAIGGAVKQTADFFGPTINGDLLHGD